MFIITNREFNQYFYENLIVYLPLTSNKDSKRPYNHHTLYNFCYGTTNYPQLLFPNRYLTTKYFEIKHISISFDIRAIQNNYKKALEGNVTKFKRKTEKY